MKIRIFFAIALLATAATAQGLPVETAASVTAQGNASEIVGGSWFGRAVPDNPWCTPGELLDPDQPDLGPCPIPREIIMSPTFEADGSFIGIASHEFTVAGGEAHGNWKATGNGIKADWLFQETDPEGNLIGASRMRMGSSSISRTEMAGTVNVYFFPFMGEDGLMIIDPVTGYPVPDPLSSVGPLIESGLDCAPPVNGCLGVFKFVVRRITVE